MTLTHESPSDKPLSLGSPIYDEYAALLLAVDDAKHAAHTAQIAGDAAAWKRAEFARWEAMGRLQVFKERHAADLLLMLRFVRECYPGRLEELIAPALRRELEVHAEALADFENRADDAEEAIAALELGREANHVSR